MKYIEVVKAVREEQMKKEASVKKLAGLLKKKAFGEKTINELAAPVSDSTKLNAQQSQAVANHHFEQAEKLWPKKIPYTNRIKAGTAAQIDANNLMEEYKKQLQNQMDRAKRAGKNYQQIADWLTPSKWKSLLIK